MRRFTAALALMLTAGSLQAQTVATKRDEVLGRVVLTWQQGSCPNGLKLAHTIPNRGSDPQLRGCWMVPYATVLLEMNGTHEMFRWAMQDFAPEASFRDRWTSWTTEGLAELRRKNEPEPASRAPTPEELRQREDARRLARNERMTQFPARGQIVATVDTPRNGTITLTDSQNAAPMTRCSGSRREGIKTAGIDSAPAPVCWSLEGGNILVESGLSGEKFRFPPASFQPNPDYVARVHSEDGQEWYDRLPAPPVEGDILATYRHPSLGMLTLTDRSCQSANRTLRVYSMGMRDTPPSSGCWGESKEVVSGYVRGQSGAMIHFTFPSGDAENNRAYSGRLK